MKPNRLHGQRAFTLLELMMVMLLIGVVSAMVLPSTMSLMTSSQLNQGTNSVVGQLKYARQLAMSENNIVEVRFYQYADANAAAAESRIRAVQLWRYNASGTRTAVDRVFRLPGRLTISADSKVTRLGDAYSSSNLASSEVVKNLPSGYQFRAFQFYPDGSTSLTSGSNYFTLITETDPIRHASEGLPANFATVQIETLTGSVNVFRP